MSLPDPDPVWALKIPYIYIDPISSGQFYCRETAHARTEQAWCRHLEKMFMEGKDVAYIETGMSLQIPIKPVQDLFVMVTIGEPFPEFKGAASMVMSWTPDIGNPIRVNLGFYNPGDNCWAIRSIIMDWLRSQLHPEESFKAGPIKSKCPNKLHGMAENAEFEKMCHNANWKFHCLWNIVLEKACTPCMQASGSFNNAANLPF